MLHWAVPGAAARLLAGAAQARPRLVALAGGTPVALSRVGLAAAPRAAWLRAVQEEVRQAEVIRAGLEEATRVARAAMTQAAATRVALA